MFYNFSDPPHKGGDMWSEKNSGVCKIVSGTYQRTWSAAKIETKKIKRTLDEELNK